VRELSHVIERGVLMCRDDEIDGDHLGLSLTTDSASVNLSDMSLEEAEALLISKALARFNGNVSQAAEALGLSRGAFYRRMEKHGLYVPSAIKKER
jgi:transcriptional regulator of acetoin/glycerol metabolism